MRIAEQIAPEAVTNGLSVRGSQQVKLEVRFIEANRDASRDLSVGSEINGSSIIAATGISAISGGIPLFGLASNNTPFGVAIARILDNGTTADAIIQALERRGLARRLAEPNLVAQSGQSASFLAGGEFPFPVQSDEDTITVEFKKFGVGLAFTPTVLGDGLINLVIEPEVSEIDPSNAIRVGGAEIPSLLVRRARTTIELRDGQSFAMAGLLQANNFKNRRQLPWIGQVPIIGVLHVQFVISKARDRVGDHRDATTGQAERALGHISGSRHRSTIGFRPMTRNFFSRASSKSGSGGRQPTKVTYPAIGQLKRPSVPGFKTRVNLWSRNSRNIGMKRLIVPVGIVVRGFGGSGRLQQR